MTVLGFYGLSFWAIEATATQPPSPTEMRIAQNNAPILWFHRQEAAKPTDPMDFLQNSSLWKYRGFQSDEKVLPPGGILEPRQIGFIEKIAAAERPSWALWLPSVFFFRHQEVYYLKKETATAALPSFRAPLLWRIGLQLEVGSRKLRVIEYWYHLDESVAAPWPRIFGHEGDWESFAALVGEDGASIAYYLRQHEGGQWYCTPKLNRSQGRVELFSALGSHATYAFAKSQTSQLLVLDETQRGTAWNTSQNLRPLALEPYYKWNIFWGEIKNMLFMSGPLAPNARNSSDLQLSLPKGSLENARTEAERVYAECAELKSMDGLVQN